MAGCKRCVPVKCGHSFTGEQLINHNKWYSITSSVLLQQYKPQCISAASSIINETIKKQALENCILSLRFSNWIFVTCLVNLNEILTNWVTCDNLKWFGDFFLFFNNELCREKQFSCPFVVGWQSPPIYFTTVRQKVVLTNLQLNPWARSLMCAVFWHVLIELCVTRLLKRCIYGEKMKTKKLHISSGVSVSESGVNGRCGGTPSDPPPPPPTCGHGAEEMAP